jgi:CheY-like chemotaxis protein
MIRGLKILIIDDEESICSTFKAIFEEEGYAVDTAASGLEGLERAKAQTPDLIFLDLKMPGIDGLDTLKRLKPLVRKVPVIVLTAHATIQSAREALKLGAADYVTKPIDLGRVREILLEHSGRMGGLL